MCAVSVIREDQEVSTLKAEPSEAEQMKMFLAGLSDKEKKKLMKWFNDIFDLHIRYSSIFTSGN